MRAYSPPPDLSQQILAKISQGKAAKQPVRRFLEESVKLLIPTTPGKSMAFYGIAGILIFFLCKAIIDKAIIRQSVNKAQAAITWEVSLVRSTGTEKESSLTECTTPMFLKDGDTFTLADNSEARIILSDISRATLENAKVKFMNNGFFLEKGKATVSVNRVAGHRAKFFVKTPYADVLVAGTEFTVEIIENGIKTAVREGKIKLIVGNNAREYSTGEEGIVIGGKFTDNRRQPSAGFPTNINHPDMSPENE